LKISHEEVSELKENLKEAQMNVNNLLIDLQKIKSEVNNNENEISRLNVKLNEAKTEVIKHENMLLNVLHTSTLALLTGASNFSENDVRRTYSYTGERRVTENLDKV
jgi:chromosome segregation ATPase